MMKNYIPKDKLIKKCEEQKVYKQLTNNLNTNLNNNNSKDNSNTNSYNSKNNSKSNSSDNNNMSSNNNILVNLKMEESNRKNQPEEKQMEVIYEL